MSSNNKESNTSCISGCSYAKLGCYNGMNGTMAPLKNPMGTQIIPSYGNIGYDSLTHGGNGNCSSYFNINDAYGGASAADGKTKYVQRPCDSCNFQPRQKANNSK